MAREGTRSRSMGLAGPALTLFVAGAVLVAIRQRRLSVAGDAAPSAALPDAGPDGPQGSGRWPTHLPHFLGGTFAGMLAGALLGAFAVVLLAVANPSVRAAFVVGSGSAPDRPPEGQYVARVLAQDMNPTLVFADDETVAAISLRREAAVSGGEGPALAPVAQDLHDNAPMLFLALGALTLASWALVMWGISAATPGIRGAGVE